MKAEMMADLRNYIPGDSSDSVFEKILIQIRYIIL